MEISFAGNIYPFEQGKKNITAIFSITEIT